MTDEMRVVTAAVLVEDGRLFLTRRPPNDKLAGYWELPGGKVEPDESLQQCLERELHEELAMDADVGEVLAETVHEYAHGCFRLVALRTFRRSDFELLAHDRFAWVARDELAEYPLAPADVALVQQLIDKGVWP